MKTLQEKYNAILEGNFSKTQFVRDARLAHSNLITQFNSFADTVAILKNKGMVVEAKKAEVTAYKKPEVDPIDMVAPDLLDHGIEAELHAAGITGTPSEEEYAKAKVKAAKELIKDPLCYKNAQTMTEPGEKMEKAKLNEGDTENTFLRDQGRLRDELSSKEVAAAVAEKPSRLAMAFKDKVMKNPENYTGKTDDETRAKLIAALKKFKLEEGYELQEEAGDNASSLIHLDTMQSVGVIDTDAMFVKIGYDKSIEKYNSLDALKVAIEKMPKIGLESAKDDLTQSDINKAHELFKQAKSELDGTTNYKLVARLSTVEDLDKEFYIWTTSTKQNQDKDVNLDAFEKKRTDTRNFASTPNQREDGTYDILGTMKETQLKEAIKTLIKKTLES